MSLPATEFFYPGANRGEILDSIVYVLTHGEGAEGIIVLTGEEGSGKSTLCRLAMKRLPVQMQAIYIAEPPVDAAEFFSEIARGLTPGVIQPEMNTACESGVPAIASLENLLDQKRAAGVQVVLLLDEAQRLTAEMLDGAGTLYEHASSRQKLLQIVFAGQNELHRTLALPSMRKVKSLVTHRFHLNPLEPGQVREYLESRIPAQAGDVAGGMFASGAVTPGAVKAIGIASGGLIRTLNQLADKSYSIASPENAEEITEEVARKAIDESGIKYKPGWRNWSKWHNSSRYRSGTALAVSVVMLALLGLLALRPPSAEFNAVAGSASARPVLPLSDSIPANVVIAPAPIPVYPPNLPDSPQIASAASQALTTVSQGQAAREPAVKPRPPEDQAAPIAVQPGTGKLSIGGVKLAGFKLLQQQMESTAKTMETVGDDQYTIQLFSTQNIQPDRMERFLIRAQNIVDLSNLYVHVMKNGDRAKFRVTYGIYSSRDRAAAAMEELPEKYQTEFHPELFAFADFR
ncbi:MAG TPA: AAA family ATPase [Nitrosospira sp.]|nr:AAA family ATPase [Nitrosospira sp.]